MKRTVFYISDGTGITAETIGHSVLSQFPNVEFHEQVIPYVSDAMRAYEAVELINHQYMQDGVKPIVFDTLVDAEVREIINKAHATNLDVFEGLVHKIADELGCVPSPVVGHSHSRSDSASYKSRIDAVHFALDNDDGGNTRHYDLADIVLLGVSRSGKTPTCVYLAMQYGIRAANYPITEEDTDEYCVPKLLLPHREKLFGLLVTPERLAVIRNERKAGSRYASYAQCEMEVRYIEQMYRRERIDYLDVTEMSVEEIATRIIQVKGLKRRFGG